MLHCQHIFCEECVATWFDRDTTCPMCRSDEWTFSIDFRFDWADESVLRWSWSCSWLNLSSCSGQKCLKIQVGETEQQASSSNCSSLAFQSFWRMCVEYQIMNSWAAFSTFYFYNCVFIPNLNWGRLWQLRSFDQKSSALRQRRRVSKRPQAADKAEVKVHCADSSRIVPN